MNTPATQTDDVIGRLKAGHRPGHALPQGFYTDRAVYRRDLERIFMRDWLYVCHASEVPAPGDYRLLEVAGESVIVVRGEDGALRALANVCRHRGSRVCDAATGNARSFVCPYHGWVYGLDGALRSARFPPEGFDGAEHGLRSLPVADFHGMVMASLDESAPSLEPAHRLMDALLAPYGLDRTTVAEVRHYEVAANWKLAVENYMECYHCGPAHPEYARRHWLAQPYDRWAPHMAAVNAGSPLSGRSVDHYADRAIDGLQFFHGRTPLRDGVVTGSEDGQPVAPLLGSLDGYDGGATDLMLGPSTFVLVYADHAVVYGFLPIDVERTAMSLTWLVREGAEAGVDYDLGRLTWLWHVTTLADKRIVELNQQGVNSRFYRPGPFSPMEVHAQRYTEWYLSVVG